MGQAPSHIVDGGEDQVLLKEVGLSLCEGGVARVGIVDDGAALVDQIGELLVSIHQLLLIISGAVLHDALDVGHVAAVVSIVVVDDDLGQEVDGIAEVRAPAHVDEALQFGCHDLLHGGGDEGLDVQHDEVIAEAVGEALLQDGRAVQSSGGTGQDIIGAVHREGDADGGELLHGLLLQVGDVAVVGAQTLHGLAVVLLTVEADLLGHQRGVVGAVGGVAQAAHGEEIVLALQRVDGVVAGEELGQLQTLGEALAECLVGDGLVPVLIGGAVGLALVVVEDEAVAELLGAFLAHLLIVFVGGIGLNGGDAALAQIHLVQLTVLVQLEADGAVGDHGDGQALKAADVGSVVVAGVGDVALGVALNVLLDQVRAIVPHGRVVAAAEALDAQLVEQSGSHRVEAVVSGHGVEVRAGILAGEDQRVVIGSFDAHTGSQHVLVGHVGGSVTGGLGLLVVIGSARHGIVGHGGVVCLVLVGVHDPLEANEEVLAGQVILHLAVDIHPVHIVPQVEGPDGRIVVVLPRRSDGGRDLAVAVKAQQTVPDVGDDVGVLSLLGVQHVPAFQLTVAALKRDELLQRDSAGGVGCLGTAGGSAAALVGAAAACSQQTGCADHAGTLEEAAAVELVRLKIDAHWIDPPRSCTAQTAVHIFLFLNPVWSAPAEKMHREDKNRTSGILALY